MKLNQYNRINSKNYNIVKHSTTDIQPINELTLKNGSKYLSKYSGGKYYFNAADFSKISFIYAPISRFWVRRSQI